MEGSKNGSSGGLAYDLGVFDLDGTLMRFDLTISDQTKNVLGSLRENGVKVVLATGRRYEGAKEHAERLGFSEDDPLVCYGGSMIRSINGETTHRSVMTVEDGLSVLKWAKERDLHARIFLDGRMIVSPETPAALTTMSNFIEDGVKVVESPLAWLKENREEPIRVTIVDFPGEVEDWLPDAERDFSESLFVTRSLPHYVEFGDPKGKKSGALKVLCERWNIDPARVIAFGDGENDIDMLRFAGHGVAVGGMTEAVRNAADAITRSVDEEGVARYVVEKVLNGRV